MAVQPAPTESRRLRLATWAVIRVLVADALVSTVGSGMDTSEPWLGWTKSVPQLKYLTVSSEYVRWNDEELQTRGFLIASSRAVGRLLDEAWEAGNDFANMHWDLENTDGGDVYAYVVEKLGVEPLSYTQQLAASVLKEACALFEIFLERSADEIIRQHGGRLKTMLADDSWRWPACRTFYREYLGIDVQPGPIESITWIRNKSTHLRSDLKTPAARSELKERLDALNVSGTTSEFEATLGLEHKPIGMARGVELTPLQVWRLLDTLRNHVEWLAVELFPFSRGDKSTSTLDLVRAGRPPKFKDFNGPAMIRY